MKGGDISSEVAPRILVVFEGIIGSLDPKKEKQYLRAARRGKWDEAISCWDLNEHALRVIWDLTYRRAQTVDVITFVSQQFADVLAARLDEEDVPVHRVWYSTPPRLARMLAYMPDVIAVYDADESHVFTYGAKGRVINSPAELGM